MFTITASLVRKASASTSPIRGSIRPGSSDPSGTIWAGTRSAVLLGMWATPVSSSRRRISARPSAPRESK